MEVLLMERTMLILATTNSSLRTAMSLYLQTLLLTLPSRSRWSRRTVT